MQQLVDLDWLRKVLQEACFLISPDIAFHGVGADGQGGYS
jgi:hypothetical protein